jgi:ribosomal-protein-alanine N-acetyltransferase
LFRQITIADAKDIHLIRTDPEVLLYLDSHAHDSIEDSQKFISKNEITYNNKEGLFWAIIEKTTGEFIGDFAYWNICGRHFRGEIGYSLKRNSWGKGYMKETMIKMFNFGFKDLNIHSVEADVNTNNERSKNVLKSMGFQKEAYFKENYFFDGEFLDSEIYSLLERNFKHSV